MSVDSIHRAAAHQIQTKGYLSGEAACDLTEREGPVGHWVTKDEIGAIKGLADDIRAGRIKGDPLAARVLDAFAQKGTSSPIRRGLGALARGVGYGMLGVVGTVIGMIGIGGAIGATTITVGPAAMAVILGACVAGGVRSSVKED